MPNWCITDIKFTGDKKDIKWLHDKILEWTSQEYTKSDFGKRWLGNIAIGSGIATIDEILNNTIEFKCRGSFDDFDDVLEDELNLWATTAWAPMLKMWKLIIEKYNLKLNLYYAAAEPGCDFYATNDVDVVANEYYYIGDNISCRVSEDEAIHWLGEDLKEKIELDDNLPDMIKKAEAEGIYVHKYDYVPAEEWD